MPPLLVARVTARGAGRSSATGRPVAPAGWQAQTDSMRIVTGAVASCLVAGLTLVAGPPAAADVGLAGRWVSDSLRDNRIGYYLVLREDSGRAAGLVGHLRFQRQDGSREARIPVSVARAGDQVIITARAGSFDRGGRTIRGRFDGSGALVLTNCLDRLRQVMSWDLASDCTLRQRG